MNLFIKRSCPFSMKVLSFASEIGELESLTLSVCDEFFENDKSIQLGLNGGKLQVPCLQIGKEWIYESEEIIERLKIQFQNFTETPITDYTSTVFSKLINLKKKVEKLDVVEV